MTRDPSDCADMAQLRAEIDALDAALIGLLARRRDYILRAAEIKRGIGWPARIDARVEEVVARVRAAAKGRELDPGLAEALWRPLIEWSIALEERQLAKPDDE